MQWIHNEVYRTPESVVPAPSDSKTGKLSDKNEYYTSHYTSH